MPTIHAPDLFPKRQKWRTAQRDQYLRDNQGIDAALLAVDLGVTQSFIEMYQRKLGLRPLTGNPRTTNRWGGRHGSKN